MSVSHGPGSYRVPWERWREYGPAEHECAVCTNWFVVYSATSQYKTSFWDNFFYDSFKFLK